MEKTELIELLTAKLDTLAKEDELLVVSDAFALTNAMGMKINQETRAATLFLEKESFAEANSFSAMLNTASRSYDDYHGHVVVYSGKNLQSLPKGDKAEMGYDEFIIHNGKLNQKEYYVMPHRVRPKDMIHETYLEKPEEGCKKVQNIVINVLDETSISAIKMEEKNIHVVLKPKRSHPYFCLQVKNNGGFQEYPDVEESSLDFTLDDKGNIVSLVSHDKYTAKIGFFTLKIDMTTTTWFLIGKDNVFDIFGTKKEIHVPAIGEAFDVYPKANA